MAIRRVRMLFLTVLAMLKAGDVPTRVADPGWNFALSPSAGTLRLSGPSSFAGTLSPRPSATLPASDLSTRDSR